MNNASPAPGRPVAFMFSGQGSQYVGMGRGLYQADAAFRAAVDQCAEILEPHLGIDLRTVFYPGEGVDPAAATEELNQTRLTQPSLFVVEFAAAALWKARGFEAASMIGHSIGEYVAATLAGVMPLADALRLVARRGALMQSLPPGSMLSVPMEEQELLPKLAEAGLSLAAINASGRCVASGEIEAVDAFAARMKAERVPCAKLHTSHAFHSHMMDPILETFTAEVARVPLAPPAIPYVSNLTGDWITAAQARDPAYYAAHLRGAVRFADGVGRLFAEPAQALIEVGPGNTLVTLSQRHPLRQPGHLLLTTIRHPKEKDQDDLAFLQKALDALAAA